MRQQNFSQQKNFIQQMESATPPSDWTDGQNRFRQMKYQAYLGKYAGADDVWRALATAYMQDGCFYYAWVIGKKVGFGADRDFVRLDSDFLSRRSCPLLSRPIPPLGDEWPDNQAMRGARWITREQFIKEIATTNSRMAWSCLTDLYITSGEALMGLWCFLVQVINTVELTPDFDVESQAVFALLNGYRTSPYLMCSLLPELRALNPTDFSGQSPKERFERIWMQLPATLNVSTTGVAQDPGEAVLGTAERK